MKSLIEDVAAAHEEPLEAARWYSATPTLIVEIARAATASTRGPGRLVETRALDAVALDDLGRAFSSGVLFFDALDACAAMASFKAAVIGSTEGAFLATAFLATAFLATAFLATAFLAGAAVVFFGAEAFRGGFEFLSSAMHCKVRKSRFSARMSAQIDGGSTVKPMRFLVLALLVVWWFSLRYSDTQSWVTSELKFSWSRRAAVLLGALSSALTPVFCSSTPVAMLLACGVSFAALGALATQRVFVSERFAASMSLLPFLGWGLALAVALNDYRVDTGVLIVAAVLAVVAMPASTLGGYLGTRLGADKDEASRGAFWVRTLSVLTASLWFVARDYSAAGALVVVSVVVCYTAASRAAPRFRTVLHSAVPLLVVLGVVVGGSVGNTLSPTPVGELAQSAESPVWKKQLMECVSMPSYNVLPQRDCYVKYFTGRAETVGVEGALDELVALHQDKILGPAFINQCHEVLHGIAYNMTQKLGVEDMLGSYRVTCTGGFAHGILVSYVKKYGWESIRSTLPTYCETLTAKIAAAMVAKGRPAPTDTTWISWNCNHMLGHVIYENTRDDMVKGALLCTTWPKDSEERGGCGAGFYMENFLDISRSLNGWKPPETVEDVFRTCREADKEMASHCYNESGMAAAYFTKYKYADTFRLCYDEAGAEFRHPCYQSIGRILVVTNDFSATASREECLLGTAVEVDAADACLSEVAQAMLSETYAPEAAKLLCDAVVQPTMIASCKQRTESLWKELEGSNAGGGTGAV